MGETIFTFHCNSLPESGATLCELDTTIRKFGVGSLKILQGGYLDLSLPYGFQPLQNLWSMDLWFYPTEVGSSDGWLLNADHSGLSDVPGGWYVRLKASRIVLGVRGNSEPSGAEVTYQVWNHIRVTHAGAGHLYLHLNGNFVNSMYFSKSMSGVRIGKPLITDDSELNRWYTGNVDEFALTLLTAQETESYTGDTAPVPDTEYPDPANPGGTGVVIDGLFLSTSKPTANQKGLLINNKFFIPFAESSEGGTSAEYYKCASVDTEAKTWSGYKAVFDSTAGTWSFESGVTSGLTYTSITPVVGGIYSADALVNVSFLYDKMRNICTAYYKLDGNCRDSVNMYDGIPNNITFVDGKIGRCAHTNGYSQYISLPNEVSVKGMTQVSYSGWCFIESTLSDEFYIITEIANSDGYTRATFGVSAALLPFAGVRTVATGDTGSFQRVTGTSPISKSTWYFLCGVFDLANGNITLYVNGVSVGSLNVTASSFVNANPYRIRIFEFEYSGSSSVRVDEVGIWSKALSADEVSELYNNGAGKSL